MGQGGPGSDGNEGALSIPQSSSITGASTSDCLVSYLGHSLEEPYPFVGMQLVYSTALVNWAVQPCSSTDMAITWLFEFHSISTSMGYSMPNPVYIYELYMICNHFLYEITFSL